MAKRMTKAEAQGLVWLVVIGLPIYWVAQLGDTVGWAPLGVVLLLVLGLLVLNKVVRTKKRRSYLMSKYQDEKIVKDLMGGCFWQGQTMEQLLDSLGKPHDIDQKILKTKKKEVWKYNHQGGNRYDLRITLDNDLVVGWDQKK